MFGFLSVINSHKKSGDKDDDKDEEEEDNEDVEEAEGPTVSHFPILFSPSNITL